MSDLRAEFESFHCNVTPARDHVLVQPSGYIDLATMPAVDEQLRALREAGWKSVVLDMRQVSFADSTAVHLILNWTSEASNDGFTFRLIAGPPNVQRVFEVSGILPLVAFTDP